jgi:hypothetical protein
MNNNQVSDDAQPIEVPAKRVRVSRDRISQKEIDDLNARHARIARSTFEIAREIIELGEKLAAVKARIGHGKWIPFVEKNLHYSMRTVQRYIKAAEQKHNLAFLDPEEFMARIWGNTPKQLKAGEGDTIDKNDVTSHFDEDEDADEDIDDDVTQHGGPGFEPGFFPDKGKPDFFVFKNFVALLEGHFFGSKSVTTDAKLEFVTELISWLENRKEALTNRKEREVQND